MFKSIYFLHKALCSENALIFKTVPCNQRERKNFTFCVKTVMKYVLSLISRADSPETTGHQPDEA